MLESPILITGAAGFIGASVAAALARAGVAVVGLDDLSAGREDRLAGVSGAAFAFIRGDVRDEDLLGGLLRDHRPAAVLHLAGRVGVRRVLADPVACESENLEGARALGAALARVAARDGLAPKVVAASTSEVYADSAAPLAESSPLRGARAEGRWRYAASKRLAEVTLDEAAAAAGAPAPVHLRFFNVVGPGQDGSSGMVLPRFVEAASRGRPLEVYGTGEQVRTFAHVDAVAGDVAALVAPAQCAPNERSAARIRAFDGPLNVGGSARTTIAALARCVAREAELGSLGRSAIVSRDPREAVSANFEEVSCRRPDLTRLRVLGLGRAPWDLVRIVRDTVRRHDAMQPSPRPPLQGPTSSLRSGAEELCASRAS